MVAPFAGTVGAQQSGAPSGMVGVPSEQVGPVDQASGGANGDGPPGDVQLPRSVPTDAAAWSVHASKHAGDLDVAIGEVSGSPTLVFSDDVNHDGREVAVDATTLEETLGDRPPTAYGLHEDGSEWTSSISYENGMAVFEVPRFSSNTVTFEGTISLTGSPAENGTRYTYDIADSESVDSLNVELEGVDHEVNRSDSTTESIGSTSITSQVDGTTAAKNAEVTMTATHPSRTQLYDAQTSYLSGVHHQNGRVFTSEWEGQRLSAYPEDSDTLDWSEDFGAEVTGLDGHGSQVFASTYDGDLIALDDSTGNKNWEVVNSGTAYSVASGDSAVYYGRSWGGNINGIDHNGTELWHDSTPDNPVDGLAVDSANDTLWAVSGPLHAYDTNGTHKWTDTEYSSGGPVTTSGGVAYLAHDDGTGQNTVAVVDPSGTEQNSYTFSQNISSLEAGNGYLLIGHDSGDVTVLDLSTGETLVTYSGHSDRVQDLDLDGDKFYSGSEDEEAHEVHWSLTDASVTQDGSTLISESGWIEPGTTVTEPVSMGVGEHTTSVDSDGPVDVSVDYTEVTETVDPAVKINGDRYDHFGALNDGETVTLDVSETSLTNGTNMVEVVVSESYDGPVGQVGFNYSHTAESDQEVDYDSEAYSERYNVSKTFAANQENATLTIPFASTVVDVRNLETRTNGGSWSTVSSSNYELDNSSLVVDLGNVAAEDTVEVRTTATKVRVTDGSITVTDPTVLGDELATEIRLEEKGSDFGIGVSSTAYDDELHYTYSESWSNPQSYAHVENNGAQELKFPNAGAGGTTRLGTIDLGVAPESGTADVRITKSGTEPEFMVRESSTAESIDFEWRETTSGHVYQLYSQTADGEVDRGEASSPVTLTYTGSGGETLAIFDLGSGGTNAGGGGGGAVTSSSTSPILLILAIGGGLVGLYLVSRRTGDESISGMALFAVGAVVMGILGMQALAPRILADWIGRGISEALPLVLLAGAAIAIVWLRQRGNDTTLNFELGGRNR